MANWYSNILSLLKGGRPQSGASSGNMGFTNFYSFISQGLDRLECSLLEEGFLTLAWFGEAMNLLKSVQSELLALVEKLDLPISPEGQEWLDQYMDETAFVLESCNLLKSSFSFFHRYRMLVEQLTFEDKTSGSLVCSEMAIKRFEFEKNKFLEELEEWKNGKRNTDNVLQHTIKQKMHQKLKKEPIAYGTMKHHKRKVHTTNNKSPGLSSFAGAMFVVKNVTVAILSFLVSVPIFPPVQLDVNHVPMGLGSPTSLGLSLSRLQHGLLEKWIKSPISSLQEYNMVENAISEVKHQVVDGKSKDEDKLSKSIGLLKQSSLTLKEGLDMFDYAVNDVFKEVLRGRNKLLRTYTERM